VWTWPRLLWCRRRKDPLFKDQVNAPAGLTYMCCLRFGFLFAFGVCLVIFGVIPSRLVSLLIANFRWAVANSNAWRQSHVRWALAAAAHYFPKDSAVLLCLVAG
jgi:hypothetical protein